MRIPAVRMTQQISASIYRLSFATILMMQTVTTMTWSLSPILMTITFADPPAFFYLEHASKYQDADRIKIRELWVPAAAIIEDGCKDEDRIIRAEARHRLRSGKGIRGNTSKTRAQSRFDTARPPPRTRFCGKRLNSLEFRPFR
jgi:hypothetical protein